MAEIRPIYIHFKRTKLFQLVMNRKALVRLVYLRGSTLFIKISRKLGVLIYSDLCELFQNNSDIFANTD